MHPVPKHEFGVAILSPWPIDYVRKLLLPHQSWLRKLRRSTAVATVRSLLEDETHASDHKPVWAVLAPCPGGRPRGALAARP